MIFSVFSPISNLQWCKEPQKKIFLNTKYPLHLSFENMVQKPKKIIQNSKNVSKYTKKNPKIQIK